MKSDLKTVITAALCVITPVLFLSPSMAADKKAATKKEAAVFEKLKDQDPTVRSAEARRLGEDNVRGAVPALIEALEDKMTGVRINAVVALGKLGDGRAVKPLTDILATDRVPAARMKAAEALAKLGGPEAAKALLEAAEDENENVRVSAVEAIGPVAGDAGVDKLIGKAGSDNAPLVRKAAVGALVKIAESNVSIRKKVKKTVKKVSRKDADAGVKKAAEKALAKLKAMRKKRKKKWLFF